MGTAMSDLGAPVCQHIKHVHDISASTKNTDWKTATNQFSRGRQIWCYAIFSLHASIATPEAKYLIENEQRPICHTPRLNCPNVLWLHRNKVHPRR